MLFWNFQENYKTILELIGGILSMSWNEWLTWVNMSSVYDKMRKSSVNWLENRLGKLYETRVGNLEVRRGNNRNSFKWWNLAFGRKTIEEIGNF